MMLPKKIAEMLGIDDGGHLSLYSDNGIIVLKKLSNYSSYQYLP